MKTVSGLLLPPLACLLGLAAAAEPVALLNASFEDDINTSTNGAFGSGNQASIPSVLISWPIVATDNSSTDNTEVAVGWLNIAPAEGTQVLSLMAGAVVGQVTDLPWSSFSIGDILRLRIAAGDRNINAPSGTPRWADDSFFGFSDGLVARVGAPPATPSPANWTTWLGKVVSRSPAVAVPPNGYKSGTMADVIHEYTVSAADVQRSGNVGIFIASLGSRDNTTNGTAAVGSTSAAGHQSFWDNVRLETVQAPGPVILSFTADTTVLPPGESATLNWEVSGADSVTIVPGIGNVAATGSVTVHPAATTTYTLTTSNAQGTKSRALTIGVTAPAVYRYFRFTPTALRGPNPNSVQLAEFQMLLLDSPLAGATASNPGGNSPGGEAPSNSVDGQLTSKWLDFNKKALVLDYQKPVAATGYRFATANDATERDPVSWILEGSLDGSAWALVDQQSYHPVPTERQAWTGTLPTLGNASYPVVPDAPQILSFAASPATITEGDSATLSWSVTGADSVLLSTVGAVNPGGSLVVSPPGNAGYSLIASNNSGVSVAAAAVVVNLLPRGTLAASDADAEFRTNLDGAVIEGPVDGTSSILDVGRLLGEERLRHLVIPFRLPNLGPGGFLRAELSVYTYSGDLGQQSRTPVNLFAIPGARVSPLPLVSDVNNGTDNHLRRGYLLQPGYLGQNTPFNASVGSGPQGSSADGLGYWLNEAYANGANAGKYVFLRLSPDALEVLEGLGFGIGTGDSFGEYAPTLSYVFNPAGVSARPVVSHFAPDPAFLENGGSATLTWSVLGATSVTISPGIGTVAASGSVIVAPTATTSYTLSASNASGSRQAATTITVVPPGAYRYFRFVTLAVRGEDTQAMNLGEIELLNGGARIPGATATAPGSNPIGGSPFNLVDGKLDTDWWDLAKAPVLLDFGTFVVAEAYRLGTAGISQWDPASWRLEGSRDGAAWTLLDEKSYYYTPTGRNVYTDAFTLVSTPPPADFRVTAVALVNNGTEVQLTWTSQPGASYTIEASGDLTPSSWSPVTTGVPSQGTTTTRAVPRDSSPARFYRIMKQ